MKTKTRHDLERLYVIASATLLMLASMSLTTEPARAFTIEGGTPDYQAVTANVLNLYPWMLADVESRFPLTVYIDVHYAAHSDVGKIWVATRYGSVHWSRYTELVAHEFAHQLWIGNSRLQQAWISEVESRGHGDWSWFTWERNPSESFAENVKRAYFSPYYTHNDYPRTTLPWLSRLEMKAFLQEQGIQP